MSPLLAAATVLALLNGIADSRPHPTAPHRGDVLLAGEPVRFDPSLVPQFSARQKAQTSDATRLGFVKWAATRHGRMLIEYFIAGPYEITVAEDATAVALGSAPQPGLATLIGDRSVSPRKAYTVVFNPSLFSLPAGMVPLAGQPATGADVMATAWAAELLHVYFYSRGISLPHHQREDFQEEWLAIATELGFPTMRHDDAEEPRPVARPRVRRVRP